MRKFIFLGYFLLLVISTYAQSPDSIHYAKNDTTIYQIDSLQLLLSLDTSGKINSTWYIHKSNAEVNYPLSAREAGLKGVVKVSCVVEKDGSLSNLIIIKGISEDLDKEALRFLKESTINSPFLVNGIPLRVKLVIPVRFSLNE
jgi:periplasmic protein TonB